MAHANRAAGGATLRTPAGGGDVSASGDAGRRYSPSMRDRDDRAQWNGQVHSGQGTLPGNWRDTSHDGRHSQRADRYIRLLTNRLAIGNLLRNLDGANLCATLRAGESDAERWLAGDPRRYLPGCQAPAASPEARARKLRAIAVRRNRLR